MSPGLVVIVPRNLPSRANALDQALAGTTIRVIIDRRQGERRQTSQPPAVERRRGDRRATPRVVGYVYACPVLAVGPLVPDTGTPPPPPVATPSSGMGLEGSDAQPLTDALSPGPPSEAGGRGHAPRGARAHRSCMGSTWRLGLRATTSRQEGPATSRLPFVAGAVPDWPDP